MPVAEDGHGQLPMFPGDPGGDDSPHDRLLFHVIEVLAEGNRILAAVNHVQAQELKARSSHRNGHEARGPAEPAPKRRHQPQNKEFRTWDGFRRAMRRLESSVRTSLQLKATDRVTKEMIYATAGGPPPRTQTRIMVETYGLEADQWPPSTWPENPPDLLNGQILDLS